MAIPEKGIPAEILSKLSKPQFKPGDAICFTWFNVKKYGYVKRFKEVNWGIQYTISFGKMSYPCGIEVNGYKTKYTTGLVKYNESKEIGQDNLRILADTGEPMYERVEVEPIENPESTDTRSTGEDIDTTNNKKPRSTKRDSNKVNTVRGGDATNHSTEKSANKSEGHSNPDLIELGDDGMQPSDQPIGGKTKKSRKANVEIDKNILSNFFKNI